MYKKLLVIPLMLCLTSCATIFNSKEYSINLYSNNTKAKAKVYDSIYSLPADVTVKRSKDDLKVVLMTDSITKEFIITSRLNPQFIWGNLAFGLYGYITDFTNPKRFYYGNELLLNDFGTGEEFNGRLKNKYATVKGQFNILFSMPYINGFYMQPRNEGVKKLGGFFGVSIGAEYYYRDNKYLKFTAGSSIDFFIPVPAPVAYDGVNQFATAYNFTLTDNYKLNRFTLGYGFNYGIHQWQLVNSGYKTEGLLPAPRKKISHGMGLSTSTYFRFSKVFFAGVVYNPTFFTVYPTTKLSYQHVISLDLLWKIKL
jgi:hypothetical protein